MHPWEYPWPHKSPLDMWAESTQATPSTALPPTFPPALPDSALKTRVNALLEHLDSGKYWPAVPAPSGTNEQPPAHGFYFSPLPRTPPAAPSGASVSTTEDVLRTAPAALARGTALAFGGTGDARELAGKGISWALQKAGIEISPETVQRAKSAALRSNPFAALVMSAPTSEDLTEKVESVTGPLYQPQTRVGKYVNSALEFVPGAVTGGPVAGGLRALPGVAFRYGVIPGLASEAAGHATEGTAAEPWARSGAALASGGAAGWLAHRSAPRGAAVPQRPVVEQSPHPAVAGDVPIATPGMSERLLTKSLEGKSAGLYEPPVKPQRPFSADYPSGAPTDASGRTRR